MGTTGQDVRQTRRGGWSFLALALAAQALAAQQLMRPANASSGPRSTPGSSIVRELEDAQTGDRWLLVRDPNRPAGPGRWILISGPGLAGRTPEQLADLKPLAELPRPEPLVLRAGDHVRVEKKTARMDACYEGVALEPAVKNALVPVRLKMGALVRGRVLAPGLVALTEEEKP